MKKKGRGDSFRYPDPKQIKLDQDNSRIFLPKLGWLRYRNSRAVLGQIKQVTLTRRAGQWFVCIQTQREVQLGGPQPQPAQGEPIGIDLGITRFATLSDGRFIEPLHSFRKHEAALRKAQQALSRKGGSATTGQKPSSRCNACTLASPTSAGTSCTRSPPSAKTTRGS